MSSGSSSATVAGSSTADTATSSAPSRAGGGIPKPVFSSPGQVEQTSTSNKVDIDALVAKYAFPEELDKARQWIRKEDNEKRIKELRKELDYIQSTNWQFE
jgi:hypothetical protein